MVAGVRRPFVHHATLSLALGSDEGAPGAAITVALCGHWEHEGCCHWPHLTTTSRDGVVLRVRTVFAATAEDEDVVRRRVADALQSGTLDGPHGRSAWTLESQGTAMVEPADVVWAHRQQPR
jgi:hypothetical protein